MTFIIIFFLPHLPNLYLHFLLFHLVFIFFSLSLSSSLSSTFLLFFLLVIICWFISTHPTRLLPLFHRDEYGKDQDRPLAGN